MSRVSLFAVLVAALTTLLLGGCAKQSSVSRAAQPGTPVTLDEEALETTFRYMMDRAQERRDRDDVFFLELPGGREASEHLLARLSNLGARVEPKSRCTIGPGGTVMDCVVGDRGALLTIRGANSRPGGSIEVEIEQHRAPLDSEGDTLTLQKRNGKWAVTRSYMRWIS